MSGTEILTFVGSRLAADAAARIKQGIEAFRVGNGAYWYLAEALKAGATFPELILVGSDESGPHTSWCRTAFPHCFQ